MTFVLLVRSGYTLRFQSESAFNRDVEQMVLDVVERRMNFEQLTAWFKARLKLYEPGDFPDWGSWQPGDPP